MEIIAETTEFYINRDTAVAIGKFDGVHLGHRRLLEEILTAKKKGLAACVFTFDIPPASLFGGDGRVLTTNAEKHVIFERMGIDFLIEFPMNAETAATPPNAFIKDYLVSSLNTRLIAAGTDVSFGRRGEGNASLLRACAASCGYEFKLVDKVCTADGDVISSTLIRDCIELGKMETATSLLGEPYSITGRVVSGNHIGHSLGFPTINVYPEENKFLPAYGVYSGHTIIEGRIYRSISNVGVKPTVGGEVKAGVETYLYDFNGDLYGADVVVQLESFMRPEKKFASLEDLKIQLKEDIESYK